LDQYLKGENDKLTFVNLNKKEDAIVNQEINNYITNNKINQENFRIISVKENEALTKYFIQELNIFPELSYVLIKDNKLINIEQ